MAVVVVAGLFLVLRMLCFVCLLFFVCLFLGGRGRGKSVFRFGFVSRKKMLRSSIKF